jgi:hypothetical protein
MCANKYSDNYAITSNPVFDGCLSETHKEEAEKLLEQGVQSDFSWGIDVDGVRWVYW